MRFFREFKHDFLIFLVLKDFLCAKTRFQGPEDVFQSRGGLPLTTKYSIPLHQRRLQWQTNPNDGLPDIFGAQQQSVWHLFVLQEFQKKRFRRHQMADTPR